MAIKVLVLDDQEQWREIFNDVLSSAGYVVDLVSDFEEAKDHIAHHRYHLAVLDLVLTGDVIVSEQPSGAQLLEDIEQYKADPRRYCGVVIVTGKAEKEKAIRELDSGSPFLKNADPPIVTKSGLDAEGFRSEKFLEVCQQVVRKVILERNRLYNQNKPRLYFDFKLGELTRVELSGPARQVTQSSQPFKLDVDDFSLRVDDLQMHFHRNPNEWRKRAKKIGGDLLGKVFAEDAELQKSLGVARNDGRRPIHIVFRGSPDLIRVPFELLPTQVGYLLGESPLTRQISGIDPNHRKGIERIFWEKTSPVEILLIAANTYPAIPGVDEEIQALSEKLQLWFAAHGLVCNVHVVRSEEATYDHVRELLNECRYHIVHYAGHGFHNRNSPDDSGLVFWKTVDKVEVKPMPIRVLRTLLRLSNTRFFFLSSCVGAMQAPEAYVEFTGNDFQGIMEGLVRVGIPDVLGYRWNLRDSDAKKFSLAFYENLLDYLDLDLAVFRARQKLQEESYDSETWASPILVAQNL
jgi:CheY-like chemotaxis protein